ncbi:helix-turn-helix transcriptional regulator [Sphingosinicella terrae]|uniref:helix-turn-helix transcriptional regulator n=1 Tax=Sphingosinicella terrae TaxID=2172047 RepID=UPI000E0D329C|nr:helix-turn-helix transcriptional regulator [Sphingosinicella terrae]
MVKPFKAESIYDAATDDGAFAELAASLAQAIGARSGVFHWKDLREQTEEVSYSGYFTAEQMEAYDRHFADADLWSAAVNRPDRLNRVWDLEQIVAPAQYARGRLYNEWIRPMGDDSFRALGGVLRTETLRAEIGFHRGRTQDAFDAETVAWVEDIFVHLRRMVAIRSKLVATQQLSDDATAGLDVLGHAVMTLDVTGRLLHANASAETILARADGLTIREGRLRALRPVDQKALQQAIDMAVAPSELEATAILVHRAAGRPYELSILSTCQEGRRRVVVVLADPEIKDLSMSGRLRELHGLTTAEADVAVRLAEGVPPALIAEERGVAPGTVHSQLKAIFAKLGCSRQSELVMIVGALPKLQPHS